MKQQHMDKFDELLEQPGITTIGNLKNPIKIMGNDTILYALGKNVVYECIIDTKSLKKVSQYTCWTARINTNTQKNIYFSAKHRETYITLHRLLCKCPEDKSVHHIDGNTLNNRKGNLKVCYAGENQLYRKINKDNTSGERNIELDKKGYHVLNINRIFKNMNIAREAREKVFEILQYYSLLDIENR